MVKAERQPMPDGRIRIPHALSEDRKEALRMLKIDGLLILNLRLVDFSAPETWIEYWFDRNAISEDALRTQIEKVVF